jgi:hypothetical protein
MKTAITTLLLLFGLTGRAQFMELYVKVIDKNHKTFTGILLHPETNVIYKYKAGQDILATKNLFYKEENYFTLYQKIETCSKTAFATDPNYPKEIYHPENCKIGYYLENTTKNFVVKNISKIIYRKKRRPKYSTIEMDFDLVEVSPEMAKIIEEKPLINRLIQTEINGVAQNVISNSNGDAFSMYNFNPEIDAVELRRLGELYKNQIFSLYYTDEKQRLELEKVSKAAVDALQKKQIIIFRHYIGD